MLTGGEIATYDGLLPVIARIKDACPDSKLYLYSAKFNDNLAQAIIRTDGLHFSLHENTTSQDVADFKQLQNHIAYYGIVDQSYRLYVNPFIIYPIPLQPSLWNRVRCFKWMTQEELFKFNSETGLPKGEKLIIWRK